MVGDLVLRRRVSGAVKRNFRPYNRWYTSPNESFEYGYPHSNALFNIYSSKAQHFAPNWSFVSKAKQLRQPITSDVTYDIDAPTVYRRIYWRKFLTLSNQMSRYIHKCIRMFHISSENRNEIDLNLRYVHRSFCLICRAPADWQSFFGGPVPIENSLIFLFQPENREKLI